MRLKCAIYFVCALQFNFCSSSKIAVFCTKAAKYVRAVIFYIIFQKRAVTVHFKSISIPRGRCNKKRWGTLVYKISSGHFRHKNGVALARLVILQCLVRTCYIHMLLNSC